MGNLKWQKLKKKSEPIKVKIEQIITSTSSYQSISCIAPTHVTTNICFTCIYSKLYYDWIGNQMKMCVLLYGYCMFFSDITSELGHTTVWENLPTLAMMPSASMLRVVVLLGLMVVYSQAQVEVEITTDTILHTVNKYFLSMTMDMGLLMPPKWNTFNFR